MGKGNDAVSAEFTSFRPAKFSGGAGSGSRDAPRVVAAGLERFPANRPNAYTKAKLLELQRRAPLAAPAGMSHSLPSSCFSSEVLAPVCGPGPPPPLKTQRDGMKAVGRGMRGRDADSWDTAVAQGLAYRQVGRGGPGSPGGLAGPAGAAGRGFGEIGGVGRGSVAPWASRKPGTEGWYYKDAMGEIQGPCAGEKLLEWHRAGLFTANMLVKPMTGTSFLPLGEAIDLATGEIRASKDADCHAKQVEDADGMDLASLSRTAEDMHRQMEQEKQSLKGESKPEQQPALAPKQAHEPPRQDLQIEGLNSPQQMRTSNHMPQGPSVLGGFPGPGGRGRGQGFGGLQAGGPRGMSSFGGEELLMPSTGFVGGFGRGLPGQGQSRMPPGSQYAPPGVFGQGMPSSSRGGMGGMQGPMGGVGGGGGMGALGNLPPPQSLGLPADTPPDIVRAALIAGYGVKAGASPFGDGSGQKQSTVSDQDLTLDRPGMKSGGSVAPFLGGHNFGNAHQHQHQHQQQHLQAQAQERFLKLQQQEEQELLRNRQQHEEALRKEREQLQQQHEEALRTQQERFRQQEEDARRVQQQQQEQIRQQDLKHKQEAEQIRQQREALARQQEEQQRLQELLRQEKEQLLRDQQEQQLQYQIKQQQDQIRQQQQQQQQEQQMRQQQQQQEQQMRQQQQQQDQFRHHQQEQQRQQQQMQQAGRSREGPPVVDSNSAHSQVARMKAMAEARAAQEEQERLQKRNSSSAIPAAAAPQAPWAGTSQSGKKTLQEVMEEERRGKDSGTQKAAAIEADKQRTMRQEEEDRKMAQQLQVQLQLQEQERMRQQSAQQERVQVEQKQQQQFLQQQQQQRLIQQQQLHQQQQQTLQREQEAVQSGNSAHAQVARMRAEAEAQALREVMRQQEEERKQAEKLSTARAREQAQALSFVQVQSAPSWGSSQGSKKAMSLAEIQEQERLEKEQEEARDSERRRREEAQGIIQPVAGGVWGSKTAASAKPMADILRETTTIAPAPVPASNDLWGDSSWQSSRSEAQTSQWCPPAAKAPTSNDLWESASSQPSRSEPQASQWKPPVAKGAPSLAEIQAQEARQRASAPQQQNSGGGAGSWANLASKNTPVQRTYVPPVVVSPVPARTPLAAPTPTTTTSHEDDQNTADGGMFWDYGADDSSANKSSASKPATSGKETPASSKSKGSGKTLSKAETSHFARWCQDELQKLTGSDDTTLGEFLMSLHSAAEVQEYVADYLGPQGIAFSEEFVLRKQMDSVEVVSNRNKKADGAGGVASVWDEVVVGATPANSQKKKKKKGGGGGGFAE